MEAVKNILKFIHNKKDLSYPCGKCKKGMMRKAKAHYWYCDKCGIIVS